jgi:hypothetical protein
MHLVDARDREAEMRADLLAACAALCCSKIAHRLFE